MSDTPNGVERLQAQIAVMREVLESVLIGAKHETYFLSDRDPNPCWHEDDWGELVLQIEAILQPRDSDGWQERIIDIQQLIAAARAWRSTNAELGPVSTKLEERRRQQEKERLTSELIQTIDTLQNDIFAPTQK